MLSLIIFIYILAVSLFTAFFVFGEIGNEKYIEDHTFIEVMIDNKKKALSKSAAGMSFEFYLSVKLVAPIIVFITVYLFSYNVSLCIIAAIAAFLTPDALLRMGNKRKQRIFEERYAMSLDIYSSYLKAGYTIMQAAKETSTNPYIYPGLKKHYATLNSDLQVGMSVADAFYHFAEETNSPDAYDVALAIDVQNEIGGKEAFIIKEMAIEMRNRVLERKEIKSLLSGTFTMVYMMDIIPFFIIAFFLLTTNMYQEFYLHSSTGMIALAIISICCLTGSAFCHCELHKVSK